MVHLIAAAKRWWVNEVNCWMAGVGSDASIAYAMAQGAFGDDRDIRNVAMTMNRNDYYRIIDRQ